MKNQKWVQKIAENVGDISIPKFFAPVIFLEFFSNCQKMYVKYYKKVVNFPISKSKIFRDAI